MYLNLNPQRAVYPKILFLDHLIITGERWILGIVTFQIMEEITRRGWGWSEEAALTLQSTVLLLPVKLTQCPLKVLNDTAPVTFIVRIFSLDVKFLLKGR